MTQDRATENRTLDTRLPRQLPRWSQLRELLVLEPAGRSRARRRLDRAYTIADLRRIARARTPDAVFDYVDGAAEQEVSLARSRREYAGIRLHPRVLRGVSDVHTSAVLLGEPAPLPLVLAPTGFTRMMHHEGERAVAAAAADAGLPYTLSTMGTTSIEDVAAVAPGGRNWFQLYLWRDHEASRELIDRARAAGYDTLVLTVDTPVPGHRIRDDRNGLTIPPTLTPRTLAGMARHPEWWLNLLTTAPLEFATLSGRAQPLAELVASLFDPGVTWTDLDWIRQAWPGHLVVKGVQAVPDAVRAVDAGADAVVLSNHGGRQLDRAPTPLSLLPGTVEALAGRAEVYVDTGIMTGADIAAAVALGATGCLVGRAYLYGLMAGGRDGVAHAIGILRSEFTRTMQLLGARTIADLTPEHVTVP